LRPFALAANIVDALEVVDVDQYHGERTAVGSRPLDLRLQARLAASTSTRRLMPMPLTTGATSRGRS
jgi:hypothetical protein